MVLFARLFSSVFVSVKVVKGHEYVYIVENRRIEGRVVQRIVQYIGRADTDTIAALRMKYGSLASRARRTSRPS